jgi:hypothetical protein
MPYQIRPDLSFCEIDSHLTFLDTGSDRYFRLSDNLERCFIAHLGGDECSQNDIHRLVDRGLLVEGEPDCEAASSLMIEKPLRSAIESTTGGSTTPVGVLLEVVGITCVAQMRLKTLRLKQILSALTAYRQRKASRAPSKPDDAYEQQMASAATAFLRARPYVPIRTCCLVDSLAMVHFLAKHGMAANLVFGVSGAPFSAHCWVQAGPLVLNDTLGNTHAHTPIRVV